MGTPFKFWELSPSDSQIEKCVAIAALHGGQNSRILFAFNQKKGDPRFVGKSPLSISLSYGHVDFQPNRLCTKLRVDLVVDNCR